MKIALTVNGTTITREVEGRQNLVDFLRYDLGFTGSHIGCEHGVCGACTVRVDGTPIRGCLMLAAQADGCRVETIEGVAESGAIAALQRAFRAENALQCGFCTPGMLLTAQALLERNPEPDPVAIREAIGGNYCRCTGYHAIVQAVSNAATGRQGRAATQAPSDKGGYVGRSVVRPQTARLVAGRGTYTDDVAVPRLLHAAFVRSPHAHARIARIETAEAAALPGVVAVVTGREMAAHCEPWVGVLKNYVGMKSAPQYPLALDKAVWQGEPVVAVVAESRALAEDGCARVRVTWEPLPPVVDAEAALAPGATVIHPELGDNLMLETRIKSGDVDAAFKTADAVYRETFDTGRHTVVSLEPRVVLADYDPADETLTVYHSGQAPYMFHDILSRHLRIPEHRVRVINKDVGGSFGLKIHTYPDEIATCALAVMLGRAVKFLADRVESFQTDIHSRDHRVTAEVAVKGDGTILGMRLDDLAPVGPFSMYPRSSVVESGQVLRTTPGPYRFRDYDARGRVVFQNKTPMSQYRAVGHPVAALVMEAMVDRVARELGLDPVTVRRRNLLTTDMYPYTAPTGLFFEKLSHEESLDAVLDLAGYPDLCAERDRLRAKGDLPRARPLRLHRPHGARGPDLRHGWGAHLLAGRHHDPARADRQADRDLERHGAGAGDRHDPGPGGRSHGGRAARGRARRHRRHHGDAVRRRHLGQPRRGHRRRGHDPDRQGAQGEHPEGRGGGARGGRARSRRSRRARGGRPDRASHACRSPSSGGWRTSARISSRRISSPSSRSRGTTCPGTSRWPSPTACSSPTWRSTWTPGS